MFTKKILWFWLKSGSLDNLGNNKIDHIVAILLCNSTFLVPVRFRKMTGSKISVWCP